jgi:phenylpropionate dioxygenase-like ring-hydroxylating dioxygenase large terminal subunit
LFRSAAGKIGLIEPSCPNRKVNMFYGIPEPEGLRCPYQGWLFDETGACVDQPSEAAGSRSKEKVRMESYPIDP